MKIVATSDTHFPVDVSKIPDGDVFIHAGDLMNTGYLPEWTAALEWLGKLPHKIKLYIPGNHDFHLQVYPGPALQDLRRIGVTVLGFPGNSGYDSYTLPNGMTVLGVGGATNLPRWAFNRTEAELADYFALTRRHDIVVTHAPAHGCLDMVRGHNTGVIAYRNFLYDSKPKIWIHGHIHECYGTHDYFGTKVYNVAMCDRNSQQVNAPMIIEV